MIDAPQEFSWSPETLKGLIAIDAEAGAQEAIRNLVNSVQAATDKITAHTELGIERIQDETLSQANNIIAEAETAVKSVNKNATQAASKMISEAEKGGKTKQAAHTAQKIISSIEDSITEINQHAIDAVHTISNLENSATEKLNKTSKAALRDISKCPSGKLMNHYKVL